MSNVRSKAKEYLFIKNTNLYQIEVTSLPFYSALISESDYLQNRL